MRKNLTLELDGQAKHPVHNPAEIREAIAQVRVGGPEFCILDDAYGSYVQCAEANGGLICEWRGLHGEVIEHVKLLDPIASDERYPPRVEGYDGYRKDEVLTVDDVVSIFDLFAREGHVPHRFRKERVDL